MCCRIIRYLFTTINFGISDGLLEILSPASVARLDKFDLFQPEEENSTNEFVYLILLTDPGGQSLCLKRTLVPSPTWTTRQDSIRMKRPRMDSESRSLFFPVANPDFLNHDDESNLSSTSNTCTKEVSRRHTCQAIFFNRN